MFKKTGISLAIVGAFTFSACETEFSLNGEYEITPVVFGLIDHTKDVHIVKITKAYMGDGDNLVYAQEPDSNYFTSVDARVIEYKNGTETGRFWQLHDSIITNKSEDGIFYGPEQKVYVFYANDLDSTAEYELVADLNEGAHSLSARTTMILGFKLANSLYLQNEVSFADNNAVEDKDYKSWVFNTQEGTNAARYNYKYTVRWTEYYTDNTSQTFSATRNNGDILQENPNQTTGTHGVSLSGRDFYEWLGTVVPDNPNVVKRHLDGIDLRVTAGHKDLDQYLSVTNPVTSIAQVQPEYTNVSGGLGLFSNRVIIEVDGFILNKNSRKQLCTGQFTATKLFCSNEPADMGESWYCP